MADVLKGAYPAANTHALALLFVAVVVVAVSARVASVARSAPRVTPSTAGHICDALVGASARRSVIRASFSSPPGSLCHF
jgi:hypothetical protein